ncbi:MAG TPA: hypothetical protein VFH50_00925 [Acidimicrobiales bacterium]|nr:hypothetical protein [Acidimicrobiales bacterium]
MVNVTASPLTGAPPDPVTVAVTVDWEEPLAVKVAGLAVTATVSGAVWVTVAVPVAAVLASVAVIVQVPAVEEAV